MLPGADSHLRVARPAATWALLQRLVSAGGARVTARDPCRERWGVTVADPDGYRLVLSHRTWP